MPGASLIEQIEAEAAANPMGQGNTIMHNDRWLLADGDALAYSAAGNDDCPIGVARRNLMDKVQAAKAIAGAGGVKILTTARSSHKGFRFAVARSKPYQGQRKGAHRPKNWEALRGMLEDGTIPDVVMTTTAEADDLFGKYATEYGAENVVIYTEDKDMRMVPGWHLDWKLHTMHFVPEGTWAIEYNDKLYGRKWFWLQMLQGDVADNIPGLPNLFPDKRRAGLVGPATALKLLADVDNDSDAAYYVSKAYFGYYGDDYAVEMLEQGVLLWMRRDAFSSPWDVLRNDGPLAFMNKTQYFESLKALKDRIKDTL